MYVSSLLTDVSLVETIIYISDHIENTSHTVNTLTHFFKELMMYCTYSVQVQFKNLVYRQRDGIPMVYLLGPMIADISIGELEKQNLKIYVFTFDRRCVDDPFAITNEDTNVETTLDLQRGSL